MKKKGIGMNGEDILKTKMWQLILQDRQILTQVDKLRNNHIRI